MIEPLTSWILSATRQSVYDTEELTALELAGRTAYKMNEVIDLVNTYNIEPKTIDIVAGAIRQNAADRTKWDFISDSAHAPINISGTYAAAVGSTIRINYLKTYKKVHAFIAGCDEYFSNAYSMSVGGSVGLSYTELKIGGKINGAGRVYYNGSAWAIQEQSGSDLIKDAANVVFTGGNLDITHSFCRARKICLTPFSISANPGPYIPTIKGYNDTSMRINFYNSTTGNLVTAADTRMDFLYTRDYNDGWFTDGTNGFSDLPLENGNIWFMGIFEK